ncbi:GNAT family N-acetyltransferase [Vibrio sp. ZSDE26]|uniref:GNAT family N-acetyltransferase n=1 Tax=Vibrio amylolyticus TaxID=2847292 RepID=A0A9X2BIL5_9VIBR|nr:GNAT family N-acetyltransferase [Vibrio amylolyticus]MCK6265176.1 GNAT family N-acetyltransferase [Vibrio amylolyticus]
MLSITISAGQMSDIEELNAMMFELHDEHHLACPEFFKTAHDIEQEKSISRYLDDPECLVFVAKVENNIVGFITGHFSELVSSVSKPVQMGSIDELYVRKAYRHQHIANQLCSTLHQRFKEYGVAQIFVEVWEFNSSAQKFYQQLGFDHHIHWLRKSI